MSRRSALLLPATCAIVALSACGKPAAPTDAKAPTPAEEVPLAVHTATLETATFVDRLQLFGRIDAKNQVRVTAEIMGQIEALPVDDGQRVVRGQTLARINARVVEAQLMQAEASAKLALAERDRTQKLVEKGLATPQQLDVATAQVAQAEAALELARASVDKAVIRSPIEGVVTNVSAKRGEIASPGLPLLEVVDVRQIEVRADVPEQDIALMREGIDVDVRVDAFPDRPLTAKVSHVGLAANRTTRTFPIKLALPNPDLSLRPGMLVTLDLTRQRVENALVLPRDAVIDDVNEKYVYVAVDGRARRRVVRLGPTRGRFVVAIDGVSAGDVLVVLGHRQVVDGQRLDVVEQRACCRDDLAPPTALTETPRAGDAARGL